MVTKITDAYIYASLGFNELTALSCRQPTSVGHHEPLNGFNFMFNWRSRALEGDMFQRGWQAVAQALVDFDIEVCVLGGRRGQLTQPRLQTQHGGHSDHTILKQKNVNGQT